jgi:threonyl-tRNA synthetase
MPTIRFPDGNQRAYEAPVSGFEIAESISKSLSKKVGLALVDGAAWDLHRKIETDATVELLTRDDPRSMEHLRHDAAHVMAQAVQELFPGTQVTIGPAIDNGFYYDFARAEPFSTHDLEAIEKRMAQIVDKNIAIERQVVSRQEALDFFQAKGEAYKVELINDLPDSETITLYTQGEFTDLCRGPHFPSTKWMGKAFKLTKVAGAYWRGNSDNAMLQRIYGTHWPSKEALDAHLKQIEEAERRDHRKLGVAMDLFHFQPDAPGCVFWHPKGWQMFMSLNDYMRARNQKAGYFEVNTPEIMDRSLWEKSGHWEAYHDNMFVTETEDGRLFAIKPMNCPGHVQIFNQGLRSYRELPYRVSEFGKVHRYEPSGALHGLLRVRGFTQDDAHIFCTEDQITQESLAIIDLVYSIYADFGFTDISVKFSDRPEKRVGSDDLWDKAESALREALESTGKDYTLNPGEGAFYGPKLEFVMRDAIGRDWQCGTLQVDFNLPERLDAEYVGEDSQRHRPVMLHRALFGSFERFVGILIEEFEGKFPLWLAPLQAVVSPITEKAEGYAMDVVEAMRKAGLRVDADLRNERINYKIREHSLAKVPIIIAVGEREMEDRSVAVRRLGSQGQTVMSLDDFLASASEEARMPESVRA